MTTSRLTRRIGAAVTGAGLVGALVVPAHAVDPVQVVLPTPTGRHQIGMTSLHLVDDSRPDPWVVGQDRRELMVSVFYPARSVAGYPVAPQMLPGAAESWGRIDFPRHGGIVDWSATATHAHVDAPVDRRGGRLPVVLYSPGLGLPRTLGTSLIEDLASRGYVVVSIDHTGESAVEFPDGHVVERTMPVPPDPAEWDGIAERALAARVADTSFVLDQLALIAGGDDPSVGGDGLPRGFGTVLDLRRVGILGHSAGGFTAGSAMYDDPRIDAGANLDGTFSPAPTDPTALSPVAAYGLDRPFLLMQSTGNSDLGPSWASFRAHQRGWVRQLELAGSVHLSYTDLLPMTAQLEAGGLLTHGQRVEIAGAVDADRGVAAQRAYVAAFFDQHLRGRDCGLFDGPSPAYPEIGFV